MGAVPVVDLAGAELLIELHHTLNERGIELRLSDVLSSVRETLARAGYEEECNPLTANQPLAAVIRDWQNQCDKIAIKVN
jgi:anti-anti-sigma regulatory factor